MDALKTEYIRRWVLSQHASLPVPTLEEFACRADDPEAFTDWWLGFVSRQSRASPRPCDFPVILPG